MIARIARRQHGVVTRLQLLEAGLSRHEIEHRRQRGALLTQHPGVYRVGHEAPSTEARYMAAVLACGDGAVLSGRAAAHLLSLIRGEPPPPEVTCPRMRRVDGVRTTRARLDRRDVTRFRGIAVTTVPRTLTDLAADMPPAELARVCHEAGVRYGTTPAQVKAVLDRRPRARGRRRLWRVLAGDERVALSALERRFLALLRANGLPLPETNRRVGSHRVDCHWPERRLTVELDSYRFHNSRHSWEQDRRREREARARDDDLRRYTWADVAEDPEPMLTELRLLLP